MLNDPKSLRIGKKTLLPLSKTKSFLKVQINLTDTFGIFSNVPPKSLITFSNAHYFLT